MPQALASATLDYKWRGGYDSSLRFQSYKNLMHPNLNGHLDTHALFFGNDWYISLRC